MAGGPVHRKGHCSRTCEWNGDAEMVKHVLFISIDSLRCDHLSVYADIPATLDNPVATPNLDRFCERATVFDTHYAGSLPCMPARREWLAGVQEFLWRPWGPIEPFDRTIPQVCRENGIVSQLITDHYHYFQHGSHGFYEDFNGFDYIRGHEVDQWRTTPAEPDPRLLTQMGVETQSELRDVGYTNRAGYARNMWGVDELDEELFFGPKVFQRVADWIRDARDWDQWFCYVDSFDVHEPFHCPEPYASMYTNEDPTDPDLTHWPLYGRVDEGESALSQREIDFVASQFAGKTTMVDRWFGRVLDRLDRVQAWDDTMVIVTSDHGHYLGDYGWMGKPQAPVYDVLARTPLLIAHPESSRERQPALTSAVDLYATILDALELPTTGGPHSHSLMPLLSDASTHRDWALYGYWGSSVNVTDGQYTYLHPANETVPAECYSTEMMNTGDRFRPRRMKPDATVGKLPYADGPVWKFSTSSHSRHEDPLLFDVREDPQQQQQLASDAVKEGQRMRELLTTALSSLEAPDSVIDRLQPL